MLKIFYSHMMDEATLSDLRRDINQIVLALADTEYEIVNGDYMISQYNINGQLKLSNASEVVRADLNMLKCADIHVVDFRPQPYFYLGSVCELVYSYLFRIPSIAIVGDEKAAKRPWLVYHATKIITDYMDLAFWVKKLSSDRLSFGNGIEEW